MDRSAQACRSPIAACSTVTACLRPWRCVTASRSRRAGTFSVGAGEEGGAVRWGDTRVARQPRLAGMKPLNRLEQVLARAEWQDDYAEGLMWDTDGLGVEGTKANPVVVGGDGTVAPPR